MRLIDRRLHQYKEVGIQLLRSYLAQPIPGEATRLVRSKYLAHARDNDLYLYFRMVDGFIRIVILNRLTKALFNTKIRIRKPFLATVQSN